MLAEAGRGTEPNLICWPILSSVVTWPIIFSPYLTEKHQDRILDKVHRASLLCERMTKLLQETGV